MKKLLLAALLSVGLCTSVAQAAEVPLPSDMTIVASAADVPPDASRFVGHWGNGAWDNVLPNELVVEWVKPDGEAQVVYAWGDYAPWNTKANWLRTTAKIEASTLTLSIMEKRDPTKTWAVVTYKFGIDGRLSGDYKLTRGGQPNKVTLTKLAQ